jgi:hypothetical protein
MYHLLCCGTRARTKSTDTIFFKKAVVFFRMFDKATAQTHITSNITPGAGAAEVVHDGKSKLAPDAQLF